MNNYYTDQQHTREHYLSLPFRGLITGQGLGKTNLALNICFGTAWDKIVLLSRNLNEPLHQKLIALVKERETVENRRILLAIDSADAYELPDIDMFDCTEKNLLIVDDLDTDSNLKRLCSLWMRGRGQNLSCLFISQRYPDTPKIIRQNLDYIFVKGPVDRKMMAREWFLREQDIPLDHMISPHFLLIDLKTQDPRQRFRNQLTN